MQAITELILVKTRKRLFRDRPLFAPHRPVSRAEIDRVEDFIGTNLPEDMVAWFLRAGYGDIDEVLSFRSEWFDKIEIEQLGLVTIFAQDNLGDFYAFRHSDSYICFLSRSETEFALVAPSFQAFMVELEKRDFKLTEWMDELPIVTYTCGT